MIRPICRLLLIGMLTYVSTALAADFVSYDAAYSAGYSLRQAGKLDESQAALEAALELTSKTRQKCDAHRMLVSVYAETGHAEKMYESAEYIVENAPYPAFSSLMLSSLLSTVHRKGISAEMKQRYEKQLEQDPKDRTALTIMEKFTNQLTRDYDKRGELIERLIELDREEGKTPDPEMFANRAFAFRLSGEYERAAELYELTSEKSKELQTFCLMKAADAWKRAGDKQKSLAAALRAHEIGPDKRSRRSLYEWHRTLGGIFLTQLKKDEAIHHLERALEETSSEAYQEQCDELLTIAKALRDSS